MLFDLRGRGRRRTVQVIYVVLALLMGGGLVFFGIGGNTNGGLFDALSSNGGGGGNTFEKQVKSAEKATRLHPTDPAVWGKLTRARFQAASSGGYDQNTGTFTKQGRSGLASAGQAWDKYLALNPKKPDDTLASLMVQAYGPTGLGRPAKAVDAMEILVSARPPSAALYGQLAQLAYIANQTRKGDLATDKAVELSPKNQRASLRQQLQSVKTQVKQQLQQQLQQQAQQQAQDQLNQGQLGGG
jgi:hypothetical protein